MQRLTFWILMVPLCSLGAPVFQKRAVSDVPELQDIKDGVAVFASVIDSVYLHGINGVPNLVEAIDKFCILAKDVSSQNVLPNSTQIDNSSDIVLAVISELKEYGCKWLGAVTSDSTICTSDKLNRLCTGVALSIGAKQLSAALRTYKKTQVLDVLTWIDLRMGGSVAPSVLQRIKNIANSSLEM